MSLIGKKVRKIGGSFQHTGTVVSEFKNCAGEDRIVLEFDPPTDGMLHIYRPDQVEVLKTYTDKMLIFHTYIEGLASCPKCGKTMCLCGLQPEKPLLRDARNVMLGFKEKFGYSPFS